MCTSTTVVNRAVPPRSRAVELSVGSNPGVRRLGCDVHPWMASYVFVSDTPATVTGADGRFALHVPPGPIVLELWHETLGEQRAEVEVPADGELELTFEAPTP